MVTPDCLNLRLIRLEGSGQWPLVPGRLSFVFPNGQPGHFVSGPKAYGFSPGDALAVNTAGSGKVCSPAGEAFSFWSFSVRLENLYPLFSGQEIARLQTVTEAFKPARLFAACQPVALECHRLLRDVTSQVDLRHRSKLLHIVAAILSAEFKQAHPHRAGFASPEQHLMQVFGELSEAELIGLPMDDLAAKFGCSRRHLNRLFHRRFGCAVATLRMELRLLKAASRLRHAKAKVIDVAVDCGFNHLGVFNVCFKRRFGVSPGQWRKLKSSAENPPSALANDGLLCALRAHGSCPFS